MSSAEFFPASIATTPSPCAAVSTRVTRLPDVCIARIAAGEVVADPAAVVRELVENALDAQARRVVISLRSGGIAGLSVEDDGIGMDAEALAVACGRHMTSKAHTLEDLDHPKFLGFRGEALASIAAAATCTIRSRPAASPHAYQVVAGPNGIGAVGPAGGGYGTTIDVGALFIDQPVRARFLRSARQEGLAVLAQVRGLAIAHAQTAFVLNSDGVEVFAAPVESEVARLRRMLGRHGPRGVSLSAQADGIQVRGALAAPPATGQVVVCVRGRMVRDDTVRATVARVMAGRLAAGRMPPVLLTIDVDGPNVDMHVHPSKEAVRFADPSGVSRVVEAALLGALEAQPFVPATPMPRASSAPRTPPLGQVRFAVGEAFLVAEADGGLVVVDQHAADERLWFNALRQRRVIDAAPVVLDPPEPCMLSTDAVHILLGAQAELRACGLDLHPDPLGVVVQACPVGLPRVALPDLLAELVDVVAMDTANISQPLQDAVDAAAARAACRAAIKAGDPLDPLGQERLVRALEEAPDGETCPHGRPTAIRIGRAELERLFGR